MGRWTPTPGAHMGIGRFIQICPYINVAPKLLNVNIQIDPFATLVPKLPTVDIQIDPFATLVPK